MTALVNDRHIAGVTVAVVQDGQVLLTKGYGFADVARRTPVDPQASMFRIGSISKVFTWTAVMQLVEQGKLDLDRDVNDYLDWKIPRDVPPADHDAAPADPHAGHGRGRARLVHRRLAPRHRDGAVAARPHAAARHAAGDVRGVLELGRCPGGPCRRARVGRLMERLHRATHPDAARDDAHDGTRAGPGGARGRRRLGLRGRGRPVRAGEDGVRDRGVAGRLGALDRGGHVALHAGAPGRRRTRRRADPPGFDRAAHAEPPVRARSPAAGDGPRLLPGLEPRAAHAAARRRHRHVPLRPAADPGRAPRAVRFDEQRRPRAGGLPAVRHRVPRSLFPGRRAVTGGAVQRPRRRPTLRRRLPVQPAEPFHVPEVVRPGRVRLDPRERRRLARAQVAVRAGAPGARGLDALPRRPVGLARRVPARRQGARGARVRRNAAADGARPAIAAREPAAPPVDPVPRSRDVRAGRGRGDRPPVRAAGPAVPRPSSRPDAV